MRPGISHLEALDGRRLEALVGAQRRPEACLARTDRTAGADGSAGSRADRRRPASGARSASPKRDYDGLLRDKARPSRIPPLGPEVAERVVALTLSDPPAEATHWVAAIMAATGISVSSGSASWRAHGLRPHRVRQFKLSNDPDFVAKLRDVVGRRPAGPRHRAARSTKSRAIQALDRTQPGLPMKKGRLGTMTHDYKRMARPPCSPPSTCSRARSSGGCMQRHRHQEFIRFLNAIEADIPAGRGACDPRQLRRPQACQGARRLGRHERFTFHFVPTSCSWLNAVEGFFAKLSKRRLKATRRLPLHCRPPGRHQPLPRRDQRQPKAGHLDRRSRHNHRRRRGHQVLDSIH